MKEKFRLLPKVLQKSITTRLGVGALFLVLFIVILIVTQDIFLCIPCLVLGGYMLLNGSFLCRNCITQNYLKIHGKCTQLERTKFRKKIKALRLVCEEKTIKVILHQRIKKLEIGEPINIYLSPKTLVYNRDQTYILSDYYALEREQN